MNLNQYRWIVLLCVVVGAVTAIAQTITQAEYYFDLDPGAGNGIPITISEADYVQVEELLTLETLAAGFHLFAIRYRDDLGVWSAPEGQHFYLHAIAESNYEFRYLTGAEYFFNEDPGEGFGTPLTITAADCVDMAALLPPTGLGAGFHSFSIRYEDDLGRWSAADGRLFYIEPIPQSDYHVHEIVAAEYFFNDDPGEGSATPIAVTPADCVSVAELAPLDGLGAGFHRFAIRYQDDLGRWCAEDGRLFYLMPGAESNYEARTITDVEYFFDDDPGEGNGTAISIAAAETVAVNELLTTEGLGLGFHTLSFRYRDDLGRWSFADGRNVYVIVVPEPVDQPTITGAEFYVNVDPGPGLGVPLLPADGSWDERDEEIIHAVPDIPAGKHLIGFRFQDSEGRWSLAMADSFIVEPILTIRISGSDAILDWISVDDATTFHVLRSSAADSIYGEIATTSDTTYTDGGVVDASERAYYRVTRDLDAPEGVFCLPVRATPSR